jgi:hypothetical protein
VYVCKTKQILVMYNSKYLFAWCILLYYVVLFVPYLVMVCSYVYGMVSAWFGSVSEGNNKGRGLVVGAAIYLDNSDELFQCLVY